MDFGISKIGVPHNLKVLEIDLDKIEAFVISHGHHDHVGAIVEALSPLSRKPRPVVVHPDAFISTRFRTSPDGKKVPIPGLKKGLIEEMKKINPGIIVPCHCTGLKAIHEFEKAFPTSFALNASGTKIYL
ncbi:hypothetical protein ES703_37086 [subsurface metagenome]